LYRDLYLADAEPAPAFLRAAVGGKVSDEITYRAEVGQQPGIRGSLLRALGRSCRDSIARHPLQLLNQRDAVRTRLRDRVGSRFRRVRLLCEQWGGRANAQQSARDESCHFMKVERDHPLSWWQHGRAG
jgi:hypothetical protein